MRYRQIHLDFHTSPLLPVGEDFDAEAFVRRLEEAHVDSVTCFARGHHGHLYYPSKRNPERIHPRTLHRNMLGEMVDACHKRAIKAPLYVTVQWDEFTSAEHPEWLAIGPDGRQVDHSPYEAGFYQVLCLNSGYRQWLTGHTRELLQTFEVDGFFFDILYPTDCSCVNCLDSMKKQGYDCSDPKQRMTFSLAMLDGFKEEMSSLIRSLRPGASIFYNTSHIGVQQRGAKKHYTHLELESLPSGDWGYLHFPVTARYARTLGLPLLAHTGKFHTEWADFHSFKNQNALDYECFRMLAMNNACLIGDQMEPRGELSKPVYDLIGKTYGAVKEKQDWCVDASALSDIAVMTPEEFLGGGRGSLPEAALGVERILSQLSLQYDFVDSQQDFGPYRLLILPDCIRVDDDLDKKISAFVARGGCVIATFESGLNSRGEYNLSCAGLGLDDPVLTPGGEKARGIMTPHNDYVDYLMPCGAVGKGLPETEHVMYMKGLEIRALDTTQTLCHRIEPYFDRSWDHFCSHKQTPSSGKIAGPGATRKDSVIVFSHALFTIYNRRGPSWCKTLLKNAVETLLGNTLLSHDGPSSLYTTLNEQKSRKRYVVHLLHYIPERRCTEIDIIEDVIPLYNLELKLRLPETVGSARLVPEGREIPIRHEGERIRLTVPEILGHRMIELNYR